MSVGVANRYRLDGPGIESTGGGGGEARFSAPVQTGCGAHHAVGTGGKARQGRGVYHSPPSSTEVEGRVELYICSPSEPS